MAFFYLLGLVAGIAGIAIIDWRYKLAFWHDKRRTILTIILSVAIFVIWDILGIVLGIFRHGESPVTLPFRLFPEFPVEELVFLTLLCYCTLVIYRGALKKWPRT